LSSGNLSNPAVKPARRFPGQAVLVLGTGRCGTSYLASFLEANGVNFGSSLRQYEAINPRGLFEHNAVVDFHRKVMGRTTVQGAEVPLLAPLHSFLLTDGDEQEAIRAIESLATPGLWGWKDPRTLLFIDYWLGLLPDAKLIIPIRHPLEVYCSYLKRIRIQALIHPSTAFFPAYARQLQRLWEIAQGNSQQVYVLDAQTAFRDPQRLWAELSAFLNAGKPLTAVYPRFHEREFTRLPLTARRCEIFGRAFPEAAEAFGKLNAIARIRFEPARRLSPADPLLAAIGFGYAKWRAVRSTVRVKRDL
jgi:Sulfotransferase family